MNILLCCSAGMSTSLIVTKMEKAAELKGISARIWAVSESVVRSEIDAVDVLLLGPQVRFLLKEMKNICDEKNIPVEVIDMMNYGMCNGEAILAQAIKLIENK
ncbi:PTS sugar transporter subunit IIB [Neobacillus sp. OS1-33]|jgi:PTS system cellobiose-specific IIB component|uniref:PTS sugar transporter subunit IIB n=1 Tax=Neobacillus sp. OS1-33 TaxID=3070683 RepID=UPI0027DFF36D|nr:PTS sugar transporter subunit IIB [Neobacillus sp. OS1-33]WML27209.1 PTS sugar transporter subunit IIB [Neobacillus sp. OS1-33]